MPKLVTETGLIVRQYVYERPTLYLVLLYITAPVLTFLFTDRDAAITIALKTEIAQYEFLADRIIVLLHAVRSAITATAELV